MGTFKELDAKLGETVDEVVAENEKRVHREYGHVFGVSLRTLENIRDNPEMPWEDVYARLDTVRDLCRQAQKSCAGIIAAKKIKEGLEQVRKDNGSEHKALREAAD